MGKMKHGKGWGVAFQIVGWWEAPPWECVRHSSAIARLRPLDVLSI